MSFYLKSYTIAFFSMLAGASVVHYLHKPDLTLPIQKVESTHKKLLPLEEEPHQQ